MEYFATVRRDRGQAIGLILIAVALIVTVAVAVAGLALRSAHHGRAQTAADAAALAGASAGEASANRIAEMNGARIIFYSELPGADGLSVTVQVSVDGEAATARASTEP